MNVLKLIGICFCSSLVGAVFTAWLLYIMKPSRKVNITIDDEEVNRRVSEADRLYHQLMERWEEEHRDNSGITEQGPGDGGEPDITC